MFGSFSLVEKLAVAGAFCALIAMGVGTEDDPGIIAAQSEVTKNATLVVHGKDRAPAKRNFWSLDDGETPATVPGPATVARPREVLPEGFGATPSPELAR